MLLSDYTTSVFNLIGQNKLQAAVDQLLPVVKGSDLFYDVLQQSSRYQDLLHSMRQGILNIEDANVEKNRIRLALLDITKVLEQKSGEEAIGKEVIPIIQQIKDDQITQTHHGNGDNIAGDKTVVQGDLIKDSRNFNFSFSVSKIIMTLFLGLIMVSAFLIFQQTNHQIDDQQREEYNKLVEQFDKLENVFVVLYNSEVGSKEFMEASKEYDELRQVLRLKINDENFRESLGQYFSLKRKISFENTTVRNHDLNDLSNQIIRDMERIKKNYFN